MQFFGLSKILVCLLIVSTTAFSQKMSPEEILAKHLDSIGTKEKRDSIKNQTAVGVSEFSVLRSGSSKAIGNAVIASESGKVILGTRYNSPTYPFEKISFDGNKVDVAFITPGLRSPIGKFIISNKQIFSEGLIGGSLSSSWAMFDTQSRKAKVISEGMKKIDGREAYILEYVPKGGSDMSIKVYFDAQTFQHIRTEYRRRFSAAQGGSPDASARQSESRQLLTEDFSEYSDENGLKLPHKYRVYLLLEGSTSSEYEWKFEFSNFLFNQKLEASSFDINAE